MARKTTRSTNSKKTTTRATAKKTTAAKKAPAKKTTRVRKTAAAATTKAAPAKPAAKTHPAATPENVQKRIAARAELKAFRTRLSGMNTTQLQQFFGGFTDKQLGSIAKALSKLESKQKERAIAERQKQIAKLQAEIEQMNG